MGSMLPYIAYMDPMGWGLFYYWLYHMTEKINKFKQHTAMRVGS